jgi:hypothetical protein
MKKLKVISLYGENKIHVYICLALPWGGILFYVIISLAQIFLSRIIKHQRQRNTNNDLIIVISLCHRSFNLIKIR